MPSFTAEHLSVLAKADNKAQVDQIIHNTFQYRYDGIPQQKLDSWQQMLSISKEETANMYHALSHLVSKCLFDDLSADKIVALLPDSLGPLCKLLAKLIASHIPQWKDDVMGSLVSPPKLLDFDWRVDVKSSSNFLSKMQVPTVLVEMQLQAQPSRLQELPADQAVQFELSKESLATMLDGLAKIRDQLAAIR
eukprot:gb/GEZN01019008.1/.p1 GENE.gb/GEZN01019008.1/~~gb/GEZN01019008.1/.p1  ORF type:complete len:193 (+),score=30.99 gb/GEZN01019008.1/:28-606(+)